MTSYYETMEAEMRELVTKYAEANMGLVRKDRDAVNEGWDPRSDPESGYLFDEMLHHVDAGMDTDESMDMYSCLIDAVADYLDGEF